MICSEVMNWCTNAVLPTPAAPSITTLYGVIISDADDAADEAAEDAAEVAREQGWDHAHPSALQGERLLTREAGEAEERDRKRRRRECVEGLKRYRRKRKTVKVQSVK